MGVSIFDPASRTTIDLSGPAKAVAALTRYAQSNGGVKVSDIAFIGIDPGQSGGIAVIYEGGSSECFKMPETERDTFDLLKMLGGEFGTPVNAVIENVHSMPKQGVASSFKFGRNYGFLRGCLIAAGIPFEEVAPGVWQRALGCLSKGDKNVTKSKAQQLFPGLKITHAVADALLIAEYARRKALTRPRGEREL